MDSIFLLLLLWGTPIVLAEWIGRKKDRIGWPWALVLGWIGFVIVALLRPGPGAGQGRREDLGDVVTFHPDLVMGAIEPGATYGLRRSDGAVLRRWGRNDPWAEVTDPPEQEDVLAAMRRPFAMKMAWQQLERGHTKLALDQAANALDEAYDAEMLEDLTAFVGAVEARGAADRDLTRAHELAHGVQRAQVELAAH